MSKPEITDRGKHLAQLLETMRQAQEDFAERRKLHKEFMDTLREQARMLSHDIIVSQPELPLAGNGFGKPGDPSPADLDAVAEENRIREVESDLERARR